MEVEDLGFERPEDGEEGAGSEEEEAVLGVPDLDVEAAGRVCEGAEEVLKVAVTVRSLKEERVRGRIGEMTSRG